MDERNLIVVSLHSDDDCVWLWQVSSDIMMMTVEVHNDVTTKRQKVKYLETWPSWFVNSLRLYIYGQNILHNQLIEALVDIILSSTALLFGSV